MESVNLIKFNMKQN